MASRNRAAYLRPKIVQDALALMERELTGRCMLTNPAVVRDYLQLRFGCHPHEVFSVVFLNTRQQVIDVVEMFRGTVNHAAIYPREIVIEALQRNASGVILTHNHPDSDGSPSVEDEVLTYAIKAALALVDIAVLDHLIITRKEVVSFAERRLL